MNVAVIQPKTLVKKNLGNQASSSISITAITKGDITILPFLGDFLSGAW